VGARDDVIQNFCIVHYQELLILEPLVCCDLCILCFLSASRADTAVGGGGDLSIAMLPHPFKSHLSSGACKKWCVCTPVGATALSSQASLAIDEKEIDFVPLPCQILF